MDQTLVLQKAESNKGLISCSFLRNQVGWDNTRAQQALDRLLTDGLAWVDLQDSSREPIYWIPSIYTSFLPSTQGG
jgi:ESCRT-II complex subunit VPS22